MLWSCPTGLGLRNTRDFSQTLRAIHDGVSARRGLTTLTVGVFTVGYFVVTVSLASLKPFSSDELLVYNVAQLPTAGDVWRGWLEAFDGMPVVTHLTTHLVGSALGFSHVTARLPAMVGFWAMCLCIFSFLRRRVPLMLASIGMLLPITVPLAYSLAYEARGYGMMLGFSAAAVVFWDRASDPRWRRLALLGLPLSLAAAIEAHFYAVLVLIPLGLAELARTVPRRRIDWLVWVGLAAVSPLLSPADPVLAHLRSLSVIGSFPRSMRLSELVDVWSQFLSVSVTYLGLLVVLCLSLDRGAMGDSSPSRTTPEGQPPASDWVLVVSCLALPAFAWLVAYLVTGVFIARYMIVTVIGFSLGIPLLCRLAVRRRPEIALLLAGWVALSAAGSAITARYAMRTKMVTTQHIAAGRGCFRLLALWDKLPADGLPIVLSDLNFFHQLHHYAPEGLKRRLVFAMDRRFHELFVPVVPFYARVLGEHIEGFEAFLRSNPAFYLYDCDTPARFPLATRLLDLGASLHGVALLDTPDVWLRQDLYRVSLPSSSPGSAPGR